MKKIVSLFTTLSIVFGALGTFTVFAEKTAADLEISTLAGLEAFRDDVNGGNTYEGKIIKLIADIDMSEKYGEGKESWMPIGSKSNPFSGIFDGANNKIDGLYINSVKSYQGLFGYISHGTVENLAVNGFVSSSDQIIGGVVAYSAGGTVSKCSFSGSVYGTYYIAGVVGWTSGGSVLDCNNTGTISAEKGYVGGVLGESNGGTITSCYNTGTVTGTSGYTGGILGSNDNTVINCYNVGEISGTNYVGGIIGNNGRDVINCYNIGTITASGTNCIGGIAGHHTVSQYVQSEMSNCYYLDTTASSGYDGTDTEGWSKSQTAAEFADKTNFTNWDFDTVWEMDASLGRPVLRSVRETPVAPHTHKICGDENCADNHDNIEWTAWDSADALPEEAGNYYLTKDVTISLPWFPEDGTALCLNGHSVRQTDKLCVIRPHGVFSLCDCAGGGAVTGGALGVAVMGEENVFNMYGGKITENHWKGGVFDGGGVVCYDGGVFNMYGGEISSNSSDAIGGVTVWGQMSIGGKAVIRDNTNAGGVTENLFLSSDSIITVNSPITDGSYIGIAYYPAFMRKFPKTISGANDADYSKYFHSDNETYKIINDENNILQFVYKNNSYPYYEITDVFAVDTENNTLDVIPPNTEFTVYAPIEQIAALEGTNYGTVILAAYDKDGALIDIGTEKITNPEYFPCAYTASLHSDERAVGSIKVFVWDSLNLMIPLANTEAKLLAGE